jgi:hypothetical protein
MTRVHFRQGFQESQRATVVSANNAYEFAGGEHFRGLLIDPAVEEYASLIHFLQGLAHELVFVNVFALRNVINIEFGFLAEVIAFQQNFPVGFPHEETLFPSVMDIRIKKVYLQAGSEQVFGGPGGTCLVTYGHLPGDGKEHKTSIFFGKGKAENVVVGVANGVGVKPRKVSHKSFNWVCGKNGGPGTHFFQVNPQISTERQKPKKTLV